jgi:hypothetical protein
MIIDILRLAPWLTAERVRRLTLVFALCTLGLIGVDFTLHAGPGHVNAHGEHLGRDFINYWAGGHLAAQGHAAQAYDIPRFLAYERSQTAASAEFKWYGYPPVAMLLSLPLSALPFVAGLAAWLLAGAAIGAAMLRARLGWRLAILAQVAAPAAFLNAYSGQNGQFTAVLMAGGVMALEKRPWLAGIAFGLICYKPHLGLLIPVALLAAGQWRAFLAAALTVVGLGLASGLLLGWDAWAGFIRNAPLNAALLEQGVSFWPRMPSLYAAARLAGLPNLAAYGVQIVSGLGAAFAVWAIWRSRAPTAVKGAGLACAAFLVTPYAWDYDLVVLTFAAVWMWAEGQTRGFEPWEKISMAAVIVSPILAPGLALALHLQPMPLLIWAWLALIARRALTRYPAGATAAGAPCADPDPATLAAGFAAR